jgi:hypothetical protein
MAFFAFAAFLAGVRPSLAPARPRLWAGSAIGAALAIAAARAPAGGTANVWILPPLVLLVAYWTSGLFFVRPMPRAERLLMAIDTRWRVRALAARCPRPLAELLELSYAAIYPLVAVAFVIARASGVTPDRFWTTVLVTDFVCFAVLAWVQTRPPRALEDTAWRSSWRAVNLRIVNTASVQVNTFPSGHAAEAVAVALLVSGAPAPLVALMALFAAAISAGAVLGRYHYAADAIAGWLVALIVWWVVSAGG